MLNVVVVCCLQICQLKAESMDREKEMRQKLQSQQKLYSDSMDSLQVSTIYGYIDIIATLLFI